MRPPTDTYSRATVVLVAALTVVAGIAVGAALASPAAPAASPAVSTTDQFQPPGPDGTGPNGSTFGYGLTRTGDTIVYATPAGESFGVANLTLSNVTDGLVTVSAEVSNPNDWLAVQHVVLRVDGTVVDRHAYALNPNETDTLTYTVDATNWTVGEHYLSVLSYQYGAVATVTVEEPLEPPANASVAIDDQTSDGTTVTVANASLPEGGFVVIHESQSLAEGDALGSVIGTSAYLPPGTYEDLTITLFDVPGAEFDRTALETDTAVTAMAHLDSNANETFDFVASDGTDDGPYLVNGSAVVDDATVTVETPTTTEPPANETTEPPITETTTEPPMNETTTESPNETATA